MSGLEKSKILPNSRYLAVLVINEKKKIAKMLSYLAVLVINTKKFHIPLASFTRRLYKIINVVNLDNAATLQSLFKSLA